MYVYILSISDEKNDSINKYFIRIHNVLMLDKVCLDSMYRKSEIYNLQKVN